VADTGSSAVIVASCQCAHCMGLSNCYDEAKSSTFAAGSGQEVVMSFGSGDVEVKSVTDAVAVGPASVLMSDGLLEMLDMKMDFSMPLEGILGLGLPATSPWPTDTGEGYVEKSFLTEANVNHFSLCLQNSGPGGGALRLGGPQGAAKKFGNIGTEHWALGLNGISVGDGVGSRMSFCSPFDMQPGQATPCGAIPDSGTTMISAPKASLAELMSGICDAWPRCAGAAGQAAHFRRSKPAVLMKLLMRCKEWISEGEGLNEMPTLHFHLTGADGGEEPIALSPNAYVIELQQDLYQNHIQSLPGSSVMQSDYHSVGAEMCALAFGTLDMESKANGPLWILGTSFFYEYVVHYNLSPQTISFERGSCGECNPAGAGSEGDQFIEAGVNGSAGRRKLRHLSTAPRLPDRYMARHGLL